MIWYIVKGGNTFIWFCKPWKNVIFQCHTLTHSIDLRRSPPVLFPKCYANPGLTSELLEENMSILSASTLMFYKADQTIFDVDRRMAGAVAKALQSKPAPTINTKKDARYTLINKRGGQSSSSCSLKNTSLLVNFRHQSSQPPPCHDWIFWDPDRVILC